MGTHLRVLSESSPMNTNMTGLTWFSKFFIFVLWTKVASALEGLSSMNKPNGCQDVVLNLGLNSVCH